MLPQTPSHRSSGLSAHSSTPFAQRIASVRFSDGAGAVNTEDMNKLLDQELRDVVLRNVELLPETIFPDHKLPFLPNDTLLKSLNTVYANSNWINPPSGSESDLARWMNSIGSALASSTGRVLLKQWSSRFAFTPLKGSPIKRKPDVILLDSADMKKVDEIQWRHVRGLCETTNEDSFHNRIRNTISNKSFIVFTTQYDRRFLPCLSFWNSKFRLTICDRSGIVHSITYTINGNVLTLLRILIALMFGDDSLVGYDVSMCRGSGGKIESITVCGVKYEVVGIIFFSETLRGRGTQCWHVQKDGEGYVIKDSWIHRGRQHSELEILKEISGIQGVPRFVCGEDIELPDKTVDSTALIRMGQSSIDIRIHRRLVMQPVGEPISSFISKKELVGAFIDIINAHELLCTEKRILHRDISYNNIMLYSDVPGTLRHGLLIDYDYASPLDRGGDYSEGDRTGTGPFMAIEVLDFADGIPARQKPMHDLESLFYVMLYICMKLKGPKNLKRTKEDLVGITIPIDQWFLMYPRHRELEEKKRAQLEYIETRFFSKFAPYFHELVDCMRSWWDVLFPPIAPNFRRLRDGRGTHDGVLKVLRQTYEKLPDYDMDAPSPSLDSTSVTSQPDSGFHSMAGTIKRSTAGGNAQGVWVDRPDSQLKRSFDQVS